VPLQLRSAAVYEHGQEIHQCESHSHGTEQTFQLLIGHEGKLDLNAVSALAEYTLHPTVKLIERFVGKRRNGNFGDHVVCLFSQESGDVKSRYVVDDQSGVFDGLQVSAEVTIDLENSKLSISAQALEKFPGDVACAGSNLNDMPSLSKVNRIADLSGGDARCLEGPADLPPILQECPEEIDSWHRRSGWEV
jgi:hypothetical protein